MKRLLITGGTGLIGVALAAEARAAGYDPVVTGRRPSSAVSTVVWDARTPAALVPHLEGADAVVHLAGATLARPPWTPGYKRLIHSSRVESGRALAEALRQVQARPRVLIQASGINYYGLHGTEPVDETTPPGNDFLAEVCKDWEASTASVEQMGVRQVVVRTALVLDPHAGVLPLIALPFRFFVGGPLGSGSQVWSWIALRDHVRALRFLLELPDVRGPYNLSAPNPVPQREFARILGRVLHRPSFFPAPAFALKLALQDLATLLLLGGQCVIPRRLQDAGFRFEYPELEPALQQLYKK